MRDEGGAVVNIETGKANFLATLRVMAEWIEAWLSLDPHAEPVIRHRPLDVSINLPNSPLFSFASFCTSQKTLNCSCYY